MSCPIAVVRNQAKQVVIEHAVDRVREEADRFRSIFSTRLSTPAAMSLALATR